LASHDDVNPSYALSLGGEPPIASRFMIEVGGVQIGIFSQVEGLSATVKVDPLPEGGQNGFVHQLPGRLEWPNIVLKKGLTQADELWKWFAKTSGEGFAAGGNKVQKTTVAITALSHTLVRLRTWNLSDAYPVKWTGPTFHQERTVLEESLEIAHNGFKPQTFPPR
jgi:phage tail-like protein